MKRSILFGAALAATLAIGAAQAASVNIITVNSPVATTTAITGSSTSGAQMDGMAVTAFFSDGTSSSATWLATVGDAGSAASSAFSLSESGDTFGGTWSLLNNTNVVLTGLKIDAGVGNTVFDIDPTNNPGTTGSFLGLPYTDLTGLTGTIGVTYSEIVALIGFAPFGDLFAIMSVDYTGMSGGLAAGQSLGFIQDTDNLNLTGDLTITPTPLPAALPLFATGLGALGLLGWRRKRKAQAA